MDGLEKISYSRLSTFEQCPRRFMYRYEQKKYSDTTSLSLEIGTIAHYGMELVAEALTKGLKPDYGYITQSVMDGYDEVDGDTTVHIPGVTELREKYFFEWVEPDNKSGMNYDEKLKIYFDNLKDMEQDEEWTPVAVEMEFDFPYKDLFRMYGFIDRVDVNKAGEYRVVDYKSSKKVFDDRDLKTPMQMYFYALAVENEFGAAPVEFVYDFVFLGKMQNACSKGYKERGEKKLAKLWEAIGECRGSGIWKSSPSPLCFWCEYSRTNPNALCEYREACQYYSLWTPHNKTYEKNKEFDPKNTEVDNKADGFWF